MQKPLTFLIPLSIAAFLALPAVAQDETTKDTVVATVNGTDITIGHMIVARATLPEQYQQLPDDILFTGILDQLIQQTALADTFEGDLPARATLSIENETRSLTAGEVVEKMMANEVSEAELQAAYDEAYANAEPEQEYNASHILVETEEEAQAIKAELEGGADFAALAREKSTGPSGPSGGSLGWFGKGMMVPSFEAATVELEAGDISDPVQTQFGWHVILLNEVRSTEAPDIKDVREELEQQVRQTKVQTSIEAVTAAATVDKSGAEGIDATLLKNTDWLE
ncbi:MAG: peptidylprolyl isomerase [Sulfitobacter sp.]